MLDLELAIQGALKKNRERVISKSLGVNQAFRGVRATANASELALQLSEQGPDDWHIQTGQGWTVLTARTFQRMTREEMEELTGRKL